MNNSVNEKPNMMPWWILSLIGQDAETSGIDVGHFEKVLDWQLVNWSRQTGIARIEAGKWWHLETCSEEPASTPEKLLKKIGSYLSNPLQKRTNLPPKISGDIDATQLRIALIGSVCDSTTRAYLHCLGNLLRSQSQPLFGPVSFKIQTHLYLPQDAHQRIDHEKIARFLLELDSLMAQTPENRPFDTVFLLQDSNISITHNHTGYQYLSPAQFGELLAQNLFHLMIAESDYLDKQLNLQSSGYVSLGSASLFYDSHQHRRRLELVAGTTLLDKFSSAKSEPFVDVAEADAVVEAVATELSSERLLGQLKQLIKEITSLPAQPPKAEADAGPESAIEQSSYFKEQISHLRMGLAKHNDAIWSGENNSSIAKAVLIKCVREIFAGKYINGKARSLEQSLLVLHKLKERYQTAEVQHALNRLEDPEWWEKSGLGDFLARIAKNDPEQGDKKDSKVSAIIPFPLLQFGFELSLLAGLAGLLGSGYYFVYRYWKKEQRKIYDKIAALETLSANQSPPILTLVQSDKIRDEIRQQIKDEMNTFSGHAQLLVERLEVYIKHVQTTLKGPLPIQDSADGYISTTFSRSVLDDWIVPGRTTPTLLIDTDSFAPSLDIQNHRVKFAECDESDYHFLVNQVFEQREETRYVLMPNDFEEGRGAEQHNAIQVARAFWQYARQLYEDVSFSMDNAIQHVCQWLGENRFMELVKQLASPPVILSLGGVALAPLYVEWKYHDLNLLQRMMKGTAVEHISNVDEGYSRTLDGNVLSVGIYQPIGVSHEIEGTLNFINTFNLLKRESFPTEPSIMYSQMIESPSFLLAIAASPEYELNLPGISLKEQQQIQAVRQRLNFSDLLRIGRVDAEARTKQPLPSREPSQKLIEQRGQVGYVQDLKQEADNLELHLMVSFDGQVDPDHLLLGQRVNLRITPSRGFESNQPYAGDVTLEPQFKVDHVDVMIWSEKASVEPPRQRMRLNPQTGPPLEFVVTPQRVGEVVIAIMLLVQNEPVYESQINCQVFSTTTADGGSKRSLLPDASQSEPSVFPVDENDTPAAQDNDRTRKE